MRTAHNIDKPPPENQATPGTACENQPTHKKQKTMVEYFRKTTIEEDIARMVCKSNLSFNQVCQTAFIRESLAAKYPGRIIPKDTKGISAKMLEYFTFAEGEVIADINKLKGEEKKFSGTLDEWTSTANYRYLNINLHYTVSHDGETAFINLGLFKINGSFPATRTLEMVSARIKCFVFINQFTI